MLINLCLLFNGGRYDALEQHITCQQPIQTCPSAPNLCLHVPLSSTSRFPCRRQNSLISRMNERASSAPVIFSALPPSVVDDVSVNNSANLKAIITPSIVAVIAKTRKPNKPTLPIPIQIRNKQEKENRKRLPKPKGTFVGRKRGEESQHPPAVMFCVGE